MKFKSTDQEIEMTVDWCVILWGANGIPVERVVEMKGELEDHLRAAIRDGKSVNEVTGDNVTDFAAAWAVENRPSITLGEQIMEWAGLLVMSAILVVASGHLWFFSLNYTIEAWWWYAAPIWIAVWTGRFEIPGVPRERKESLPVRIMISGGIGVLAGLLMAGINVAIHMGDVSSLFDWSWVSTLILILLGVPLLKNRRRTDVLPILEEWEEQEPRGDAR